MIDKKLDHFVNRLTTLEKEHQQLNVTVSHIEDSVSYLSTEYDQLKRQVNRNQKEMQEMAKDIQSYSQVVKNTKTMADDLQSRQMRSNLIFHNVQTTPNENPELIIKDIFKSKLQINEPIHMDRVHRIGNKSNETHDKPRPIVVKFTNYKQHEMVRLSSNKLKGTKIGIQEQFGKAVQEKRRILHQKMMRAREEEKFSKLVFDSLLIENERFRVNSDGNIVKDTSYYPPQETVPSERYYRENHRSHFQDNRQHQTANDTRYHRISPKGNPRGAYHRRY